MKIFSRSVVLLACLSGCFAPRATTCADGRICPPAKLCAPSGGCVNPDQLVACAGKVDGDACTASIGTSVCREGACELAYCGDGLITGNEKCDDGNAISADGCRGDCLKAEICHDGIVDANETCDDNNFNAVDGCDECRITEWRATALAGGASSTSVSLRPGHLATDALGNVYIADVANNRVLKLDVHTGAVSTVAGTGKAGSGGDGDFATSATLSAPRGVAVDGLGNVHIADTASARIRRVDAVTGIITTIAGTGTLGFSGDDGPARFAQLYLPFDVAIDGFGNVFIADTLNRRIRRVDASTQ